MGAFDRARLGLWAWAALAAGAVPAEAQVCPRWLGRAAQEHRTLCFVPVDVAQGPALGGPAPTAYTFAGKAQAAVGVGGRGGPLRVGPVAAALYDGSRWSAAGGARASVRVVPRRAPTLGSAWGVFLGGEYLLDRADLGDPQEWSLSLGAHLPFGVRVTGAYVRQAQAGRDAVQLGIGADLNVLVPLLRPGRDADPARGAGGAR